jgi:phosphoribosylanthranilate isomerase
LPGKETVDQVVRVKLCGMMSLEDLAMAESAGADAVGFVTEYPVPVPWNLTRGEAAELVSSVSPFVTTVAVVGGNPEQMVRIALRVRPKVLQLHGDESLEEIISVIKELKDTGIKVIKAMRVDTDTGLARFDETDPVKAAGLLAESGMSALVMDSKTSTMPAGTGVPLDWDMAAAVGRQTDLPLVLAGGLTAGNVSEAVRVVKPYAVDVISGVEDEPGVKNLEKMKALITAAKGINDQQR